MFCTLVQKVDKCFDVFVKTVVVIEHRCLFPGPYTPPKSMMHFYTSPCSAKFINVLPISAQFTNFPLFALNVSFSCLIFGFWLPHFDHYALAHRSLHVAFWTLLDVSLRREVSVHC